MSTHSKGQSLIETLVGIIFLIPIVLFMFNVFTLILTSQTHDVVLKDAARAAASGSTPAEGTTNARAVVTTFNTKTFSPNGLIEGITMTGNYTDRNGAVTAFGPLNGGNAPGAPAAVSAGNSTVSVRSRMTVRLPVPVPIARFTFQAAAIEPLVGQPPSQ